MTKWLLKCTSCGRINKLDLGYNLYEFKRIYIYCDHCNKNTFHEIVGHEEEKETDKQV